MDLWVANDAKGTLIEPTNQLSINELNGHLASAIYPARMALSKSGYGVRSG